MLSYENIDFIISISRVMRDKCIKLEDEKNILNNTLHTTEEQSIEYIKLNQHLTDRIEMLNEALNDIQIELTHDIPDEDKIENIRDIINSYVK